MPLKVVIINKSDSTGGAAVVSRRLMEALREEGADARMLVTEKLTESPYVETAAPGWKIKEKFLLERVGIFYDNGFNRDTLFKIDTASEGLPLWKHPLVKEADAVLINWVNQGMLSLKGIKRITELGKPVIVTMHDMWWMTGICHHAGECCHYHKKCGECYLLGKKKGSSDVSLKVWEKKCKLYGEGTKDTFQGVFVAVSRWLKNKAEQSSLLKGARLEVIPNAFRIMPKKEERKRDETEKIRILFGAARLDDPIKGLPVVREMTKILKKRDERLAERLELITFGGVKNPETLQGFAISHIHKGMIRGEENIKKLYEDSDLTVSASSYETLPGTLVEAQAYGCIPVSFDRGGQSDIIDDGLTGFLVTYSDNLKEAAERLAEGVLKGVEIVRDREKYRNFAERMRQSVKERFEASQVAKKYLQLIDKMTKFAEPCREI